MGKAITVISTAGPQTTIIDGGQTATVVTFNTGEGLTSVLNGFTIQNGFPSSSSNDDGGGISINGTSPTILNNFIINNQACEGAGVAVLFGSPLIEGNTIDHNVQGGCSGGTDGGGILLQGAGSAQIIGNRITNNTIYFDGGGIGLFAAGTPTIENNIISGNSASDVGGGISMVNGSGAIIVQNLIVGNSASYEGGGIYWLGGSGGPTLVNNTIAANLSPSGSALFSDGSSTQTVVINDVIVGSSGQSAIACSSYYGSVLQVQYSDVFSTSASPYDSSCGPDQTGTNGNISADPLFFDPTNNNFHVQFGSPVIGAGSISAPNLLTTDLDGNPRIRNGTVDMGAYEFFPTTVTVGPSSLIFGNQAFGTTSSAQIVTVTNTGTNTLLLAIVVSGDFVQTNNCGTTLAAGLNCSINVSFAPTVRGTRTGSLTITSNAASSPNVVTLSGTGTGPTAVLSASSLTFGNQLLDTTSPAQIVTVSNLGDSPLIFASIAASGDFAQTNTCSGGVAVGLSCTVSVTYTPSAVGASAGNLTFVDNAPGTPQTVSLTGTGFIYATPQISLPLVPSSAAPGGAAFTLTLNGSGFFSASVVNWNGSPRTTTLVSATQLTAAILASDIATVGTALVTVVNPTPGGGTSNAAVFEITTGTESLTFSRSDFAVGRSPAAVAEGDFNGDGKVDLAVANGDDNTVSILLGKGDGTFQPPVNYATGLYPTAIVVGDFNKDGKLDLAVANLSCPANGGDCISGTVSIFLGNGDGTFQSQTTLNTGMVPQSIAAGDFNGDGVLDLAVADQSSQPENYFGAVTIFLGNGDGTFQPGVDYAVGPEYSGAPISVITADFNGDGKLDIAAVNAYNSNTVSILLGNGDGTFQAQVQYATGLQPYRVVASDFNGDGKLDLATANFGTGANSVSVLLGNGDGTFQSHVDYPTGIGPISLATGDINGDGKQDLAVVNYNANTVSILLGNGDGTFQANQDFNTGVSPDGLVVYDFNGDGLLDLATANWGSNNVSILLQAPPVVALSITNLGFGNQPLGTASAAQSVTVTNTGTGVLSISSIAFTGPNGGDFGQTNNCGSSVAAGASCTINVTFTPTAVGAETGTLTLTDNASGSPQTVSLSGTGTGPGVSLSSPLTFTSQMVGTTSSSQTVTLTNTGNAKLTLTAIGATGPFAIAASGTTCTTSNPVAAAATCTVAVTFTPTAGGAASGSLSFSDNASGSPQSVALNGTGQDFSFAPPSGSSTSATVAPGSAATYTLSVGGEGGLSGAVNFTCTGAPSEATCTVSPNPATAGSSATNVTVTVTTTAPSASTPRSRPLPPAPPLSPGLRGLLMFALVLAVMAWALARRKHRGVNGWRATTMPIIAGLLLILALAGCGGGGSTGGGPPPNPGTPAGTYPLKVTGTVGSGSSALSHTVTLTLTVS